MTLEEAQAMLTQVNNAIASLINGKTISNFIISDGNFRREYKYVTGDLASNLKALREMRDELINIINTLSPPTTTAFRTAVYQNIVTKR